MALREQDEVADLQYDSLNIKLFWRDPKISISAKMSIYDYCNCTIIFILVLFDQ